MVLDISVVVIVTFYFGGSKKAQCFKVHQNLDGVDGFFFLDGAYIYVNFKD